MTTNDLLKYFNRKKPTGATVLLIFGIIYFLCALAIEGSPVHIIIGMAMVAVGIWLIVRFNSNISDNKVDDFCKSIADEYYRSKRLIAESKEDIVTDAICETEYCFDNLFSARMAARGKDNIMRSSILGISCMFFTNESVYYYSQKISLITEEKFENQKDFYLKDIQMVSLEQINQSFAVVITIPGNEKVYINCRSKENAIEFCDKIKHKTHEKQYSDPWSHS